MSGLSNQTFSTYRSLEGGVHLYASMSYVETRDSNLSGRNSKFLGQHCVLNTRKEPISSWEHHPSGDFSCLIDKDILPLFVKVIPVVPAVAWTSVHDALPDLMN
jgi:hypothetical protein